MGEKKSEKEEVKHKSRRETRKAMNMENLGDAVDTINNFAAMYRKATMAVKNLERAQGQAGGAAKGGGMSGMFGGMGNDPISAMMMPAIEQAVQQQASKLVEKKAKGVDASTSAVDVSEEEMEEARGGFEGEAEEEEEAEEET